MTKEPTIRDARHALAQIMQTVSDKCRECATHYGQSGGICEAERCPLHNLRAKIEASGVPMFWIETGRMP